MEDSNQLLSAYREREAALLRYGNGCRGFFIALTVLTLLAAAGVSIAALIVGEQAAAIDRYSTNRPPKVLGYVELNSNSRTISYRIQYFNLTAIIIALPIHGPVPAGAVDGPLAVELCGSFSGIACDITSEANVVEGELTQIEPGSTSPRPVIQAIRKEPERYYTRVMTGNGEEERLYLG